MIKAFENFANLAVEWTPENPDKNIFNKIDPTQKKWLKIYSDYGFIKKMLRVDNDFHLWLDDGRVFSLTLKKYSEKSTELYFTNRYSWDLDAGLSKKYDALQKKTVASVMDHLDYIISTSNYSRLITELDLADVTSIKQRENGTFCFRSNRKYIKGISRHNDVRNVMYVVYSRGDVTVEEAYMPRALNKKRIKIENWKDYIPFLDLIYEHEKAAIKRAEVVTENMDKEEFEKEMEEDDDFIPNDILKNFSQEDQFTYVMHTHPDHDLYIFVGRPGYKDVVVNDKKYKEEVLHIETLCRIDKASDMKQANMMKMRATAQGEGSRVYSIWLPKGVFDDDEQYISGSNIPDFMLPLIDQHKKPI